MTVEQDARDCKLAEQEILRQSLEEKDERIQALQIKVELLESMLNRASALRAGLPQPQPLPAHRNAPRRWSVR